MSTKDYELGPIPGCRQVEKPPPAQEPSAFGEAPDGFPEGEPFPVDVRTSPQRVAAEEQILDSYMGLLTLRQKIGQRFIAHMKGTVLSQETWELIRENYVGGIILYPWNVESSMQVKELTASIQQAAVENDPPVRLFICVDQEGGRVNAFKLNELTRFPSPYYWGQHGDPAYVESAAYVICREISELGCNMNFAPVLDVYGQPDSTIIGDRSMGEDPDELGMLGIHYLRGARRAGVISVIKHFPGHGSTIIDSHLDLPVVDMTEAELSERDFKPFRLAIENGAEALMTSHVLYRMIDPEFPATLSVYILRKLLRERLDYEGVIISDGISMGALSKNFDLTETILLSFKAGIDLILVHARYDLSEMISIVENLLSEGSITEHEIDEGVRRVLRLKLRYGLLTEY